MHDDDLFPPLENIYHKIIIKVHIGLLKELFISCSINHQFEHIRGVVGLHLLNVWFNHIEYVQWMKDKGHQVKALRHVNQEHVKCCFHGND